MLFLLVLVLVATSVVADDNCKSVASKTSFLTADTFAHDVAHGIHSLTVEDVEIFFGVDISSVDKNGIPTANFNTSDVEHPVLDDAPFAGFEKVYFYF
jgi:hypothetical protein